MGILINDNKLLRFSRSFRYFFAILNNSSLNNNVLKNWYGEGYYKTTIDYIKGAVKYDLTKESGTYDFSYWNNNMLDTNGA